MYETVEKTSVLPLKSTSGFTLPEFDLPPVLPTDIDSLTALLHSLIKSHGDVKHAALSHINFLHEQIVLLVTDVKYELAAIGQLYRDRCD